MATFFLRGKGKRERFFDMPKATVTRNGERLSIAINHKLKSPNEIKNSWVLYDERKKWTLFLATALARAAGFLSIEGWRIEHPAIPPATRMHIALRRECPSARNFIQDADNRAFSYKPILDALKHVALIVDDKERWISSEPLEQVVSSDGEWRTVITLTPAGAPLPLPPRKPRARKKVGP